MVMTLQELYLYGKEQLTKAELSSPAFDALELLGFCFNFRGRSALAMRSKEVVSDSDTKRYIELIEMRKCRPLQYILGKWEFCDMELYVGEGVLVPREDTQVLVDRAVSFIGDKQACVYDLCAGSGAVALGVAKSCANASIKCLELSEQAAVYLDKNIKEYGKGKVEFILADVFDKSVLPPPESVDIIVSNPPYIPARDIEQLEWEVKCEPSLALDGGNDGLDFYRFFAENWCDCLKPGGMIAVEVGINQAEDVAKLFENAGLCNITFDKDFAGIDRVVYATKGSSGDF